jgi:hypothetical protein
MRYALKTSNFAEICKNSASAFGNVGMFANTHPSHPLCFLNRAKERFFFKNTNYIFSATRHCQVLRTLTGLPIIHCPLSIAQSRRDGIMHHRAVQHVERLNHKEHKVTQRKLRETSATSWFNTHPRPDSVPDLTVSISSLREHVPTLGNLPEHSENKTAHSVFMPDVPRTKPHSRFSCRTFREQNRTLGFDAGHSENKTALSDPMPKQIKTYKLNQ